MSQRGMTPLHHLHTTMPKRLLTLPQDVLNQILEHLLPPLRHGTAHIPLHDLNRIPDPFDLYNVMLTCKALYGMAHPWVWRRVEVIDAQRSSRWRYLVDHPEAAVHVRLFMMDTGCESKDPSVFGLILMATQLMQNIRVLISRQPVVSPLGSQIFKDLISKPHMHTLSTLHRSTEAVSLPRSLRRLFYIAQPSPGWTLDSAPNLESLALAGQRYFPDTSSIPWASLRDIEVCGTETLTAVLNSFAAWRRTHPDTQSLLQDAIFFDDITADVMCRIFDTFRGQNLTSVCFDSIPLLDATFIQRLVEEFPHVRRLGLMTGDIVSDWPLKLIEIAQTLGRLRMLTWLQWNYIGPGAVSTQHEYNSSSLTAQFHDVLWALEDHCAASLRRIDFRDGTQKYSYERAEGGSFLQEECSTSLSVMLHNDSWRCDIYDRM